MLWAKLSRMHRISICGPLSSGSLVMGTFLPRKDWYIYAAKWWAHFCREEMGTHKALKSPWALASQFSAFAKFIFHFCTIRLKPVALHLFTAPIFLEAPNLWVRCSRLWGSTMGSWIHNGFLHFGQVFGFAVDSWTNDGFVDSPWFMMGFLIPDGFLDPRHWPLADLRIFWC